MSHIKQAETDQKTDVWSRQAALKMRQVMQNLPENHSYFMSFTGRQVIASTTYMHVMQ